MRSLFRIDPLLPFSGIVDSLEFVLTAISTSGSTGGTEATAAKVASQSSFSMNNDPAAAKQPVHSRTRNVTAATVFLTSNWTRQNS